MLSSKAFLAVVLLLGALAIAAPLHLVFLARYPLVMLKAGVSLGGVRVDPADLVLGLILLSLLLRRRPKAERERQSWPYMLPWIVLGLLLSAAYLAAPINQENLTSLPRTAYQLYRYCWKGILFYPLALLLLNDRARIENALLAVVLAGDLLALQAIVSGYTGVMLIRPFPFGNALAGYMVAPFLLSTIGLLVPRVRYRLFFIGSTLLILRGLLFTTSRGGIVAVTAGACFCGAWLLTRRTGRARIARVLPAALVAIALLFALKPDILQRPTIRQALTAKEGLGAGTMQWRIQDRWPLFVELIRENPWLGIGTDVHPDLVRDGRRLGAPTPHSGYLSLAVTHGIPAASVYLLMALLALWNGLRLFARSDDPWESALGLVLAAGLFGILVHNTVEATIGSLFVGDLFWLLCALSAQGTLLLNPGRREVTQATPAGASLRTA